MPKGNTCYDRLPRFFHKSFVPERQYIHALLSFAAGDNDGDYLKISRETGIPTGEFTGKVPAILDYCRGMGLVYLLDSQPSSVKRPRLTNLGRIVYLEDPFLREPLTQWIVHLNMCSVQSGADVWYQVFHAHAQELGSRFKRQHLEDLLAMAYGTKQGNLIGPLVRTYEEDASLLGCGALASDGDEIVRNAAPIREEFAIAYGAWLLELVHLHFPRQDQITVTELDSRGGWRTIPKWGISESQDVLQLMERNQLIQVDRHMKPWILRPLTTTEKAWAQIYSELI